MDFVFKSVYFKILASKISLVKKGLLRARQVKYRFIRMMVFNQIHIHARVNSKSTTKVLFLYQKI